MRKLLTGLTIGMLGLSLTACDSVKDMVCEDEIVQEEKYVEEENYGLMLGSEEVSAEELLEHIFNDLNPSEDGKGSFYRRNVYLYDDELNQTTIKLEKTSGLEKECVLYVQYDALLEAFFDEKCDGTIEYVAGGFIGNNVENLNMYQLEIIKEEYRKQLQILYNGLQIK